MKKIILLMVVFITACTGVKNNSFMYKGKPINPFCLPRHSMESGTFAKTKIEDGLKELEEYKNNKKDYVEEEYDEKEKKYTVSIIHIHDGKEESSYKYYYRHIKQIGNEHLIEYYGDTGGSMGPDMFTYFVTCDGEYTYPKDVVVWGHGDINGDILSYINGPSDGDFVRGIGLKIKYGFLYEGDIGWRHGINSTIHIVFECDIKTRKRSFRGVKLADSRKNEKTNFCDKKSTRFINGDLYCEEEHFDEINKARCTFNKIYMKYAKKCAVKGEDYAFLSGENLENFKKDLHEAFK
ncbi:MAG: hypothetical protein ACTSXG_01640 [Alphaproteobacteria bacterium]